MDTGSMLWGRSGKNARNAKANRKRCDGKSPGSIVRCLEDKPGRGVDMETKKKNDLAGPGRPAGRKWIFWTFPRSECGGFGKPNGPLRSCPPHSDRTPLSVMASTIRPAHGGVGAEPGGAGLEAPMGRARFPMKRPTRRYTGLWRRAAASCEPTYSTETIN